MQLSLFRKDQKVHHHILSGLLVSLVAVHAAFGIDHMLAASEKMSKLVTLKVVKSGNGIVQSTAEAQISCGKQCSARLEPGTEVTLVARAETGSYVKGWTVPECRAERGVRTDLSSSTSVSVCRITMKSTNRNIAVSFARVPRSAPVGPTLSGEPNPPLMCRMDTKACSDGSTVGRTGPKCEFVCPTSKGSPSNDK